MEESKFTFDRFTEKSIKCIMLAQEETLRRGHKVVGCEQLLLGLIGEGTGIAAKTLKLNKVDLKTARAYVEKIIGRGQGMVALLQLPFSDDVTTVLNHAIIESEKLGYNYTGTEHLLLALVSPENGVPADRNNAVAVLKQFKVVPSAMIERMLTLMGRVPE